MAPGKRGRTLMAEYVYANATCAVTVNGTRVRLTEGDAYEHNNAVVKAHPGLFAPHPTRVNGAKYRPVETATARPGEKRRAR